MHFECRHKKPLRDGVVLCLATTTPLKGFVTSTVYHPDGLPISNNSKS